MINSTGATLDTPVLIAQKNAFPNGSSDSTPQLTVVDGQNVSVILELQSREGALLISRMTTAERDLMVVENGMMVYNLDENSFNIRANNSWEKLTGNAILPTVANNIAIFADTVGTIRDSGVPIAPRVLSLGPSALAPLSDLEISNLGYVQFAGTAGYAFLGEQAAIQIFEQPSPQNVCVVITDGGIPPGPSSNSVAFEINTRSGALLVSRMGNADVAALDNPQDGMMVYDADLEIFRFRQGGEWTTAQTGIQELTIITGDYQTLYSDSVIMSNVPTFSPVIGLPHPVPTGQAFRIFDYAGTAQTFPVNLNGNGKMINGINTNPSVNSTVGTGVLPWKLATNYVNRIFCINNAANSVTTYDSTNTLISTITGPAVTGINAPEDIAVTPNGKRLFIANGGAVTGVNGLTVIENADIGFPSFMVSRNTGNTPISVCITPDGNYAYLACAASNNVTMIGNASIGTPTTGTTLTDPSILVPIKVVTGSGGAYLYILNSAITTKLVTVYAAASSGAPFFFGNLEIVSSLSASSIAVSPDGLHIWVGTTDGSIYVFSAGTLQLQASFAVSAFSNLHIAFTPDGNHAYVITSSGINLVWIYKNASTSTPTFLKTIATVDTPREVCFSAGGYYAYITNGFNVVTVIGGASSDDSRVLTDLTSGSNSRSVIVRPDGKFAYVANRSSANITIIKDATGYPYITQNYGGAYLIYNGAQWNAVRFTA